MQYMSEFEKNLFSRYLVKSLPTHKISSLYVEGRVYKSHSNLPDWAWERLLNQFESASVNFSILNMSDQAFWVGNIIIFTCLKLLEQYFIITA